MHVRLIAVGDRQPAWVDEAFAMYSARFPREWRFRVDAIGTARRGRSDKPDAARDDEGRRILARVEAAERVVLLDEQGNRPTSREFAGRLADWQTDGRDLCFVIGGPDGVSAACRERADFVWSLSALTLPHGLARVLFAEQLYRAWTLLTGHPYHRD
jgi:23S rRNA (pseudouridine1915-N3)-methyltransferase